MVVHPLLPGSPYFLRRRPQRLYPSTSAYTNPGVVTQPPAAPRVGVALPPTFLPAILASHRPPRAQAFLRWQKAVNPGDVGGPAGSASAKPFLPRVPRPGSADYERRMARQTEKLHSIVNSLIAQGQLVQTGISEWTVTPAAGSAVTSFDGRAGAVLLTAADVLAALQDTLTLQNATTGTLIHLQAGVDSNSSDAFTFDENVVVGGPDGKVWANDLNLANQIGVGTPILVIGLQGDVASSFSSLLIARLDTANTFTVGGHVVAVEADATKGLQIRQHSGTQSANLTEWTDSTGATVKAAVLPGGGFYSAGAFAESAATAGAFLGIVSGTPRWMLANGTNYWECDNASGVLRFIYSTGQKVGVDPVNNFYAFAMNLSVGFDTSTAPPYSARFWVYHNVAAGTAASNPSVVFEQNTNGTPAAGFGGALVFRAKDSTTSSSLVGELQFVYSTATHASFKGRIIHGVHDSGTSVSSPRMYLQGDTDGARGTSSVPCGGSTSTARVGGGIFDHFADANNGTTVETDLYSDTVAASTLSVNGDKVTAQYGGTFTGDATSTQRLRAYFGGTLIFDSGALGIGVTAVSWSLMVTCVRESSSNVRCSCAFTSSFATLGGDAGYVKVTGLTLTNTQVLKITGTAAGATGGSNQITASEGYVEFKPAA